MRTQDFDSLWTRKLQRMNDVDALELVEQSAIVAPVLWGRDHFQLILLVAGICINEGGNIDATDDRKFRVDGFEYPTRIAGGIPVEGHDDYDCLNDAIRAGVFETREDDTVFITETGGRVVMMLELEKQGGTDWQGVNIMPAFKLCYIEFEKTETNGATFHRVAAYDLRTNNLLMFIPYNPIETPSFKNAASSAYNTLYQWTLQSGYGVVAKEQQS